jgi:broad specificity phosphatase PhoE
VPELSIIDITVCLNVVRHPVIPVRRGQETYDQRLDPAFRRANDDIDPVDGPAGVKAAMPHLLLDAGRPVRIRHSTTVRTRKGAELFAELLGADYDVTIAEEAALAELEYDAARLWTRAEHTHPEFTRARRLERFFRAMLVDDDPAYPGGHTVLAQAVAALRRVLLTAGPVNHLWVSHGLVMPFISMSIVEGIPPAAWTMERARAIGAADYATGFHVRLPLTALA